MTNFDTKIGNVLNHLKKYGNISSWEAITLYKATRLSAIIYDLKEKGYEFKTITEENDETGSRYARYYLISQKDVAKK